MRAITKDPEPMSLTVHRQTPHCDYDNYAAKDDLRNALVSEQRGLCCYCMGRIHNEPTTMKIEHWWCRAHHSGEQLNYRNLLGACRGGGRAAAAFTALRHAERGYRPCLESCRSSAPHRDPYPVRAGWLDPRG